MAVMAAIMIIGKTITVKDTIINVVTLVMIAVMAEADSSEKPTNDFIESKGHDDGNSDGDDDGGINSGGW